MNNLHPEVKLVVYSVLAAFGGFVVGYVFALIRRWWKDRKFVKEENSAAKWIRTHSIKQIANAVKAGNVTLQYDTRHLVAVIANEISLNDIEEEETAADTKNHELIEQLEIIGELKDGEKF